MAKLIQNITIALIVSVAICNASPARLERLKPSKSKFLARQEVAEDVPAQTPYPPAGIKPEVRFDLPTDEKLVVPDNTYLPPLQEPAQTYGPPAKTYGPPEVSVKDEVEQVDSNEPVQPEEPQPEQPQPEEESSEQPEEVEPSQQSEEEQQEDDAPEEVVETEAEQIEAEIKRVEEEEGLNNSLPERLVLARGSGRKAAKLRSAKLQSIAPRPIYLVNYNGQLYRLLK